MKIFRVYTDDIDGEYDIKYYFNLANVCEDIASHEDSSRVRRCTDIETEDEIDEGCDELSEKE